MSIRLNNDIGTQNAGEMLINNWVHREKSKTKMKQRTNKGAKEEKNTVIVWHAGRMAPEFLNLNVVIVWSSTNTPA